MDLNAPLGRRPPSPHRRIGPILLLAVAAVGLAVLGAYLWQADPRGGEPFAVAAIPPLPPPRPSPARDSVAPDPMPTGSIPTSAAPTPPLPPDTTTIENGVRVVSPSSGAEPTHPGPLIIDVTKALDGGDRRKPPFGKTASAESIPKLVTGPLSGSTARPRIALVVGGLGLSDVPTRTAIDAMPAAVDLAFVPYGATLAASVDKARARGHEILLQLPMRGPQGAAVGPHTLGPDETPAQMTDDLAWLTSRFGDYAGVTNLLGASVTAKKDAMSAILKAVGQRGAFYIDDGTSRRSIAQSLAADLGVPMVQADVVVDATADPAVLRANLDRLLAIARTKGSAIGTASALSDHVAAVARFASELDGRGFALVPVGVIARGGPSIATTR